MRNDQSWPRSSVSNDRYLRAVRPIPNTSSSSPSKRQSVSMELPSPSSFSMEVTLDFDASPGSIPSSAILPKLESTSTKLSLEPRNLKSPSELGLPMGSEQGPMTSSRPTSRRQLSLAKILPMDSSGGQQRTKQLLQSVKAQASTRSLNEVEPHSSNCPSNPSLICSLAYRGQEMLFCAIKDRIVGVCPRTRVKLQYLTIPNNERVVFISANPSTAQILVALSNGMICTYHPVPTSPRPKSFMSSAHVRYRWRGGPTIDCRPIFFSLDEASLESVQVNSSADYKVLVCHGNQLAIYLTAPGISTQEQAEVIWTARLDHSIYSARISGDGQAIAYVLNDGDKNTPGVHTFLRDFEDGGSAASIKDGERSLSNLSVGVIYRPGPMLLHTHAVTKISFRGFGRRTSSSTNEYDDGNDLLLTYCSSDNTIRIFSQNSWEQLVQWSTPPHTEVDWLRGITACNLGDLDPPKGPKRPQSQASSRRPSFELATNLPNRSFPQSILAHPAPSTSAGAWVFELSFRSALPAIRLSRLSYLKRGSEEIRAAHFESVSAVLPAKSIMAEGILGKGELGLSVHGLWPAWHASSVKSRTDGPLDGSAMSFLGVSAGNAVSNGYFGESNQGGTHSPPSELRVISSHPKTGHVVIMEFPLWGDQDLGAMELGSPLRYILSLSDVDTYKHAICSLSFENNKLCAQIEEEAKSVAITWRKRGSSLVLPKSGNQSDHMIYSDTSVVPVPLLLSSLQLPSQSKERDDKIVAVQWWPDEDYGGPPQLVCLTRLGTVLVFEMPPPWSALEPVMPSLDPLRDSSHSGSLGGDDIDTCETDGDSQSLDPLKDYDVLIRPHPEFGIGLRLEAQNEGMPAIVGSFKKHPLTGGSLPAEMTGMVILGDELLSVNDVDLEGITFEEIIANVRQIGSDTSLTVPLRMRFRPKISTRRRIQNAAFSSTDIPEPTGRRSRELILGVSPARSSNRKSSLPENELIENNLSAIDINSDMSQEFARIIAMIPNVVDNIPYDLSMESRIILLPWLIKNTSPSNLRGAALLVVAIGKILHFQRLEVSCDCDPHNAKGIDLYRLELDSDISNLQAVKSDADRWYICVVTGAGNHKLVTVTMDATCSIGVEQHPFNFGTTGDCMMRLYSSTLLGTLEPQGDSPHRSVVIWTALPDAKAQTSKDLSDVDVAQQRESHCYHKTVLSLNTLPSDTEVVDFQFIGPGSLGGYPWIACFTLTSATVFMNHRGSNEWKPLLTVSYPCLPTSTPKITPYLQIQPGLSPTEAYPHLESTLINLIDMHSRSKFIRSDFNADSILAYICTDTNGPMLALQNNVKGIMEWLSGWKLGETGSYPSTNSDIEVTPFQFLKCDNLLTQHKPLDAVADQGGNTAASLFSPKIATFVDKTESQEKVAMNELQRILLTRMKEASGPDADSPIGKETLPPPLRSLIPDEIRFLWAIGELVNRQHSLKALDVPAQHAYFCVMLIRQMKEAPNEADGKIETGFFTREKMLDLFSAGSFGFSKRKDFMIEDSSSKTQQAFIAVAGAFAALTSCTQNALIEACRPVGGQFDWEIASCLRMPFWIRSDEELRKISEEIGKNIYLKTKDIMECALFFLIAGNMKTLKNLSLTDHSTSGKKFSSFLTAYDFASPQGRNAAEKNAFSLLRKNRHNVAASFFLLAQPPMLKTAVETIMSKTGDFNLAFLMARLVEKNPKTQSSDSSFLGGFSNRFIPESSSDESRFKDWVPNIGKISKELIHSRGLEIAQNDHCFTALQFMWLSQKEEAGRKLVVTDDVTSNRFPGSFEKEYREDVSKSLRSSVGKNPESANDRVIQKANEVIDFVSRPFLLNFMKSSIRTRWASTLLVCDALTRSGIELPSARCLLQNTSELDFNEDEPKACTVSSRKQITSSIFETSNQKSELAQQTSSIFDNFDLPSKQKPPTSIFDSYDPPVKSRPHEESRKAASSIFDAFDVPAPKPKEHLQVTSSIFDAFDVPAPKPKEHLQSGKVTSSIFDSFESPPVQTKALSNSHGNVKASGVSHVEQMTSSIFDSFAVPSPKVLGLSNQANISEKKTSFEANEIKDNEDSSEIPELSSLCTPSIWMKWRHDLLVETVARRMIREVSRHVKKLNLEMVFPAINDFSGLRHPLIPSSAVEILRQHCDGDKFLKKITRSVSDVCKSSGLEISVVVEKAIRFIYSNGQSRNLLLSAIIYVASEMPDRAEDVIRDSAVMQIIRCETFTLCHDNLMERGDTLHHLSSLQLRRDAVSVSWQLEICLWLHRGGIIPLSSVVLKEAIIGVRIGFVLASWGRNHECLDALIRNDPDCPLDENGGRQIWSSMKLITGLENNKPKTSNAQGSGGWEFLVDCHREEATVMLKSKPSGSFIIRPHQGDNGVFTLSFKTNLAPPVENDETTGESIESAPLSNGKPPSGKTGKNDVVQHAIIRLSDAGFRCGSFGPFTTLLKLLEAVSKSLPFDLLFDKPPTEGIIKDEEHHPSPNSVFLRKFAISSQSDPHPKESSENKGRPKPLSQSVVSEENEPTINDNEQNHLMCLGTFSQLLTLSEIRTQLCAIAAADFEELVDEEEVDVVNGTSTLEANANDSVSGNDACSFGVEDQYAYAARVVRPLLIWCNFMEIQALNAIAPDTIDLSKELEGKLCALACTDSSIELAPHQSRSILDGGDAMVRRLIQPDSGVEFRTLRVGEGGESAMIVLFSKYDALSWIKSSGMERTDKDALNRLARMEERRVIEKIALSDLNLKEFSYKHNHESRDTLCYRFVDPWEVEAVANREGETKAAALGREYFMECSVSAIANSSESFFRKLGGFQLLGLWTNEMGGLRLTKALASVHAPWERDVGGDLQMSKGITSEPSTYQNAIRQHLYRNMLLRRLQLPQRFLALVQVELLDLKNLTAAGGSSLSVYALLRLKRQGSSAPLSHKARTLDSASTQPTKIGKSSGPNAPASWGALVRFRFPLPEDVHCDGTSFNDDREAVFKGPPCTLQISVCEKKFMSDSTLGGADVKLDALTNGGQMEEWVPLRSPKHGVNWFVRMRLTLRFELMCLPSSDIDSNLPPSVGRSKIQKLSKAGGTHEDRVKKSESNPDILSYLESMVY